MNPYHLLEQADALTGLDAGRPRGANLRRAVSSAYYAVFHHRIEAAAAQLLGTSSQARGTRLILARGYSHEGFRGISVQFGADVGGWPT